MVIEKGEKVFVIHRKFFDNDVRRHFFGVVEYCDTNIARATGRLFTLDHRTNLFTCRDQARTRLIPFTAAGVIINIIPQSVDIDRIHYNSPEAGVLHITDDSPWFLDVSLF